MQDEKHALKKPVTEAEAKEAKPISILAEKIKEIEDKSEIVVEQLKDNLQTQNILEIKKDVNDDEDEKKRKKKNIVENKPDLKSKRKIYNIKTSRNKEIVLNRDRQKKNRKGYSFVVRAELQGTSKRRFDRQLKHLKRELNEGNLSQTAYENKRSLLQQKTKQQLITDAYYLSDLTGKKIISKNMNAYDASDLPGKKINGRNLNAYDLGDLTDDKKTLGQIKRSMRVNGYETVSYDSLRNTVTITTKEFMHRRKVQTMKFDKYLKLQAGGDKPLYHYGEKAAGEIGQAAGRKLLDTTKSKLSQNNNLESETSRLMLEAPDTVYRGYKTAKSAKRTLENGIQTVYNAMSEKHIAKTMTKEAGLGGLKLGLKGLEFGFNKTQDSLEKNRNLESDTVNTLVSAPYKTVKNVKKFKNSVQFTKKAIEQMLKVANEARKIVVAAAKVMAKLLVEIIAALGWPVLLMILVLVIVMFVLMAISGEVVVNTTSNNQILEPLYTYATQLKDEYKDAVEVKKEEFLKANSNQQDCKYGNNDIIKNTYYCLDGDTATYELDVSTRFVYIYSAMIIHYNGDLQGIYDSTLSNITKEELEEYVNVSFTYMYDKDNINIIKSEYEKTDDCKQEPRYDADGNLTGYDHEHEYGGFDIYIDVKSGNALLDWLITQNLLTTEQKTDVYAFMGELQGLVLTETEQDIIVKGFSYATYYGDGEASVAVDKTELVELRGVELNEITDFATNYIGYKYVYGGKDINTGIDCSGFVAFVYDHFGITSLNGKGTSGQINVGQPVSSLNEAQPGDLIFYNHPVSHVAMYLGNNLIIHASNSSPYPKGGVKISQATYGNINCIKRIVDTIDTIN